MLAGFCVGSVVDVVWEGDELSEDMSAMDAKER